MNTEYHIYLSENIAKNGGTISLTLINGKKIDYIIPANVQNDSRQRLKKASGAEGFIHFYHLWDENINFKNELVSCIDNFEVQSKTKTLLHQAIDNIIYSQGNFFNLAVFDLLDYAVLHKRKKFQKRYTIATQYARIKLLDETIENAIKGEESKGIQKFLNNFINTASTSDSSLKIRMIWQLVKLQQPIDDWESLEKLDEIILNAQIPQSLKAYYSKASLLVKTITTDLWVLRVIQEAFQYKEKELKDYSKQWHQLRSGKKDRINLFQNKAKNHQIKENLDQMVFSSDIPEPAKIIYQLVQTEALTEVESIDPELFEKQFNIAKETVKQSSKSYNFVKDFAIHVGAKAGTGAAITSLTGGAQITSTLAWLGMGAGLGMIGGLAVLTGGAALLGAVAVFSIANLMHPMDKEGIKNAGIGAASGLGIGTGVAWGIWSIALASSGYSGAAAITSTLAMFGGGSLAAGGLGMSGGLMVLTGGAATVAIIAGVSINWLLNEMNHGKIIKQMEEQVIKINQELVELGLE